MSGSFPLRLMLVQAIEEKAAGATILFRSGQKGHWSGHREDYASRLNIVRRGAERGIPVAVRIDGSGEISDIVRADNDLVAFIGEESGGSVKVGFLGHDGLASLERKHPDYLRIRGDLDWALKEKTRIWFVWGHLRLTLEDVMIIDSGRSPENAPGY